MAATGQREKPGGPDELTTQVRRLAEQFATCRDEARVRVHLATMELREVWTETSRLLDYIEAKLSEFGDKADSANEIARLQGELALIEAREAKDMLHKRLEEIGMQVSKTRHTAATESHAIISKVRQACREWAEKLQH